MNQNKNEINYEGWRDFMKINDSSWKAIILSDDGDVKIVFFNPLEDEHKNTPFEMSFQDFMLEASEMYFDYADNEVVKGEDFMKITNSSAEYYEDHDEFGKSSGYIGQASVFHGFKDLKMKDIDSAIVEIKKAAEIAKESAEELEQDSHSLRKDPYKYYGVSRS